MALDNAETIAVQLEKVRAKLPVLYERDDTFYSMIQRREVERVSTRAARIPLQVGAGGNFGYASFDGGDLGRGSGTAYDVGTITPIGIRQAVEITKLTEYATNSREKAIANVVKRNIADAMKQTRRDMDAALQTAGNGVVATITAVNGNTLTLQDSGFGARLIRNQQNIQVYDSTLTTNRGEFNATAVFQSLGAAQQVVCSAVPAGTVAGDLLVFDGLSGAQPVFIYGIPYFHNTSTAGTYLTIARTNPYAVANGVSANGAALTLPPCRLAFNQIRQALGEQAMGNLCWHGHPAQVAAYEELGFVISEIEKGSGNRDLELLFNGKKTIGGVRIKENIHADITRLDLLNLNAWGRVTFKEVDFYEVGGQTVFPVYGTSGGVATSFLTYLVLGANYFVDNPRSLSSVTDLAVPAGY